MDTDSAERTRPRCGGRRWALLAPVLAVVAHLPGALRNQFAFDDYRFVVRNPYVTRPESWLAFFTDPHTVDPLSPTGIVRPLRTLEFAVDHAVFGLSAQAFHLHGLVWHLVAVVLVFLLVRRLTKSPVAAAIGASIWAVHPVQVESVAWITSRGDVAMGACVVGSLLLALRSRGVDRHLWGSLALGAVAMLYKETAVVLPLLVFAVRLAPRSPDARVDIWRTALSAWPWANLSILYLAYRTHVMIGGFAHVDTHVMGGSTAGTFATMFRGFGYYLTAMAVPARQALDWYLPASTSLTDPAALGWLVVHGGIVYAAVRLVSRRPLVSVGICLLYFPLIPVANWPFPLGIPTAERFLYLPLIGFALLAGTVAARPSLKWSRPLVLGSLVVLSLLQTRIWQDDDTLWPAQLRTHESPRALKYRSAEALRAGKAARIADDHREADAHFRRALADAHAAIDLWHRIESVSHSTSHVVAEPQILAANACFLLGEYDHCLFHAEQAIRVNESGWPQSHYNRALALLELRRPVAAVHALLRARALWGGGPNLEHARAFVRAEEQMRQAGAFAARTLALEAALDAAPAVVQERIEDSLKRLESFRDTTVKDARDRVARVPDDAGAHLTYALELARGGRYELAQTEWETATRLRSPIPWERVEWIRVRHALRGGREAWTAALSGYEAVRPPTADSLFQTARCLEDLLRDAEALPRFRQALAAAEREGDRPPWEDRATRAVERIEAGCPAWRDHGAGGPDRD